MMFDSEVTTGLAEVGLVEISKKFGKTLAVDNVSLEVNKGTFFTLLGPSGCGKTTTLRIIAGLLKPDHGEVYIKGSRVTDTAPYQRNIGMVFQSYALFPYLSVYDNIAFGLRVRHFPKDEMPPLIEEVLGTINLLGLEDRLPKELSGGQQQRVALARALVFKPSVLLLDEPLSNLDLKVRMIMRREIKNLTKRLNTTTINVTHDQGEALSMSDRIGVMDRGELIQVGTPTEIYDHPANQFVANFIGETNFLEAKIARLDNDFVCLKVLDLLVYAKRDAEPHKTPKIGEKVLLSVRPEKITISKNKQEGKNAFRGRIEEAEYFGSFTKYAVRIGEVSLNCESNSESYVRRGDEVHVRFNPEDCFISSV
jgi:ABC-type Fe3+/spermidine/putrescine transport system ATPase subunit